MVTSFSPSSQLSLLFQRIAEEAGCSSGRVYLASVLTKMAILSNLIYQAARQADALERNNEGLWRLKWRGFEQLKTLTEFRCAIADIVRNIKQYWGSANHSRNTVKSNIQWLQSLGLFAASAVIEQPIGYKIKGEWRPLSPDKRFLRFDLPKVLEAYQALEQLLRQHLAIKTPRRQKKSKPFTLPSHAGMIARMVYTAVIGRQYRPFSRLPDGLEDLTTTAEKRERMGNMAYSLQQEIHGQISLLCSGHLTDRQTLKDLEKTRGKALATIAALDKQAVFLAELPW